MKRVVTTFFSFIATVALLAPTANAQQTRHTVATSRWSTPKPVPVAAQKQLPFGEFAQKPSNPYLHGGLSPLVAEDSISYFQDNGFSTWPMGDTVLDSQTGEPRTSPDGVPYVRFMNLQRFDAPGTQPVLDSVHIAFIADTLIPGSHLVVSLMTVDTLEYTNSSTGESFWWPLPWANGPIGASKSISISKIHLHEVVDTVVKWKPGLKLNVDDSLGQYKGVFCVGLSSYALGNQLRMIADSTNTDPSTQLDPTVDRSYWLAYSADGKYFLRDFWGGHYYTDVDTKESVYHPNFVMTAFTHDAAAAVGTNASSISSLSPCVPNPVSSSAAIEYSLNSYAQVHLAVYNTLGIEVASLVDRAQNAGPQSVTFDASKLPNGTYYYKLQAGDYTATRMMVVAK